MCVCTQVHTYFPIVLDTVNTVTKLNKLINYLMTEIKRIVYQQFKCSGLSTEKVSGLVCAFVVGWTNFVKLFILPQICVLSIMSIMNHVHHESCPSWIMVCPIMSIFNTTGGLSVLSIMNHVHLVHHRQLCQDHPFSSFLLSFILFFHQAFINCSNKYKGSIYMYTTRWWIL